MSVRKIVPTGLLALLMAAMLSEIPGTAAQENQFGGKYPQLVEAVKGGKLSKALFEAAMQFETKYPRLVMAFNRERIDYKLFRAAFRGVRRGDQGVMKLVQAFQDRTIGISDFRRQIAVFQEDLHRSLAACSESWCDDRARVYYTGCMMGSGDAFACFILTEQYMCVCMNSYCGWSNDCGLIG